MQAMATAARQARWANSWLGRLLGTCLGLYSSGSAIWLAASGMSDIERALTALGLAAFGVLLVLAVWTSELHVEGDVLIARHLFSVRRMDLTRLESAEPGILGLVFTDESGRRLRSLVSGTAGDEFWTTRAEKICDAVEEHAFLARDPSSDSST